MSQPAYTTPCTLWGLPHSLYAGKARAYLIKKGIPFKELGPAHPDFNERVVPAVGHLVLPVVELADGTLLQDTTDIIEYFESACPTPAMIPATPVQAVLAWLVGAYGSEALLPAAMHYRWSYRAEQETFLRAEFGRAVYLGPDRDQRREAGAALMEYFSGMLPSLGVTAATASSVETSYLDMLDALDCHFQQFPYVLGGLPSLADFGLMAPLFAHLARDPVPATLMKNRAPNVYRWTERMNTPGFFDGEFYDARQCYFDDDNIPESLENILRLIFRDWGSEVMASCAFYEQWLNDNPNLPAGHLVSASGERQVHPSIGSISFELLGQRVQKACSTQTLWHVDKALSTAASLTGSSRNRFSQLLQNTGGEALFACRLARPIARANYALVLA